MRSPFSVSHFPRCRNTPIFTPPPKPLCIKSPFASTQYQTTFQIIQIFSLLFFVLDPYKYNGIALCPRRVLAVPDCSQRRVRLRRLPRRQHCRPLSMVIERNHSNLHFAKPWLLRWIMCEYDSKIYFSIQLEV